MFSPFSNHIRGPVLCNSQWPQSTQSQGSGLLEPHGAVQSEPGGRRPGGAALRCQLQGADAPWISSANVICPLVWQQSSLFLWRAFPTTARWLHGSEGATPAPGSRGGQSELCRILVSTVVGSGWGCSLYKQGSILGLTLGLIREMLPFRWDWSSVSPGACGG